MKRRTKPPRRTSRPARRSKVKERNRVRHDREWRRAYGSEERVVWVQRQPCVAFRCVERPCVNAHIKNDGMGRKGDSTKIVPMCRTHDRLWHTQGPVAFAEKTGLGRDLLLDAARATEAGWKSYLGEMSE